MQLRGRVSRLESPENASCWICQQLAETVWVFSEGFFCEETKLKEKHAMAGDAVGLSVAAVAAMAFPAVAVAATRTPLPSVEPLRTVLLNVAMMSPN